MLKFPFSFKPSFFKANNFALWSSKFYLVPIHFLTEILRNIERSQLSLSCIGGSIWFQHYIEFGTHVNGESVDYLTFEVTNTQFIWLQGTSPDQMMYWKFSTLIFTITSAAAPKGRNSLNFIALDLRQDTFLVLATLNKLLNLFGLHLLNKMAISSKS